MTFDLMFTPFQLIVATVLTVSAFILYWAISRKRYKLAAAVVAVCIVASFMSPARLTTNTQTVNTQRVIEIENRRASTPLPERVEVDATDRSSYRELLDSRTQELRDRQQTN